MSTKILSFPSNHLKSWFQAVKRPLPWRQDPTPYRVWISEVMLQQTQVSVVIPYFERWMTFFPTVEALAKAPLEHVLKVWEGLGYYSRVRHVHEAARLLVAKYGGELPNDSHHLAQIKGLGPYTRGAILSFAFHQKAAALDGNVMRVLSRFFAIDEEIDLPATKKRLWSYSEAILPDEESWLVTEGLIELGALVCMKEPRCNECPLKHACLAFRHGLQKTLPKRRPRVQTTYLTRLVGVISHQDQFLVQKGEKGRVMADLYEFPYVEYDTQESIVGHFEKKLGLPLHYTAPLHEEAHSFTRFQVKLLPHLMTAESLDSRYMWKEREKLLDLPFSSGHRRILNRFLES